VLLKGIGGRSVDIARGPCSLTLKNTLPKGDFALRTASRGSTAADGASLID
jgi:hypothetical protein